MEIEAESGMPSTAAGAAAGSGCGLCGLRVRVPACVCLCVLPVAQLLLMSTLHAVQLGVHWAKDASQLQIEHG